MSHVSPDKKIEWTERIRRQQESGLSIERWCQQNQIATHQFHYWKSRLLSLEVNVNCQQVNRSCFREITALEGAGIVLEYGALRIRLEPNFELATLKQCLTILKEVVC